MGKTVHYHPVSLTVIRASVIYQGWRFGRIKQTFVSEADGVAQYTCVIEKIPPDATFPDAWRITTLLQECFADDIHVLGVWLPKNAKKWKCSLRVTNFPDIAEPAPAQDVSWLIPDEVKIYNQLRAMPDPLLEAAIAEGNDNRDRPF